MYVVENGNWKDSYMAKRYIFIDTETTGLTAYDRIVEIAAIELDEAFNPTRVLHEYLDPGIPVGTSTRFHGLTDKFLAGRKTFKDIAAHFVDFIDGATVLAHNMPFDSHFISSALQESGYKSMNFYVERSIDTLKVARQQFYGQASLDALVKRFGIDGSLREKHHGALIDVELLIQVYLHLINCPDTINKSIFDKINKIDSIYQSLFSKQKIQYLTIIYHVNQPDKDLEVALNKNNKTALNPEVNLVNDLPKPKQNGEKIDAISQTSLITDERDQGRASVPSSPPETIPNAIPPENTQLFSAAGRIGRWAFAKIVIAYTLCGGALGLLANISEKSDQFFLLILVYVGILALLCCMGFAIIKRCADAGISPYWSLACLVPFVCLILIISLLCLPTKSPLEIDTTKNKKASKAFIVTLALLFLIPFLAIFIIASKEKSDEPQNQRFNTPQKQQSYTPQQTTPSTQPKYSSQEPTYRYQESRTQQQTQNFQPKKENHQQSQPASTWQGSDYVGGFKLSYFNIYLTTTNPSRVFFYDFPQIGRAYCENCDKFDGKSALVFIASPNPGIAITIFVAPKGSTLSWGGGARSGLALEEISCKNYMRQLSGIYAYEDYFLKGTQSQINSLDNPYPWEPEPVRSLVYSKMVRPLVCGP